MVTHGYTAASLARCSAKFPGKYMYGVPYAVAYLCRVSQKVDLYKTGHTDALKTTARLGSRAS